METSLNDLRREREELRDAIAQMEADRLATGDNSDAKTSSFSLAWSRVRLEAVERRLAEAGEKL